MNLVLDIGNTRVKYAVFLKNKLIHHGFWLENDLLEGFENLLIVHPDIAYAIWCQSGADRPDLYQRLQGKLSVVHMTHQSKLPIENHYKTPNTLGLDRLALASAAQLYAPGKASLIIDCGTCVTYDFIDANGRYFGGAISPGLSMRYRAMHHYTDRLPNLRAESTKALYGDSTDSSMHQGAFRGLIHEIDGFIDQYKAHNPNLTTFLTGGDLEILRDHIKNDIFAHSNFLLEGLNQILLINKD
ncbi:MAG TPA: pantothenate kinase [Flavobacteriaceae bacterium]|nr:pantothenate kinase [Flavobacteriaceae bacterium]